MAFRNYTAGERVADASVSVNHNSSDVSDVSAEYAQVDAAQVQVQAAIVAAKAAFPTWATGSIQERANILDRAGAEVKVTREPSGIIGLIAP